MVLSIRNTVYSGGLILGLTLVTDVEFRRICFESLIRSALAGDQLGDGHGSDFASLRLAIANWIAS